MLLRMTILDAPQGNVVRGDKTYADPLPVTW